VITAGRNRDPRRLKLQQDQVKVSTRGCQIIAESSGHVVARDKPDILIEGIRATIEASRRGADTPCDWMDPEA
jgi:hypothetical protein